MIAVPSPKAPSPVMQMTRDQATPIPRPQSGSMSVYLPTYAVEVVDFMGRGFSLTAFAGHIGQPFEVVCDWIRDSPEFALAVGKARAKRVTALETTFLETESGPKVTSHKHALNNAAPHEWRDRIEHTGEGGGPIVIASALEEARKRAAIDVPFTPVDDTQKALPSPEAAPAETKPAMSVADALKAKRKP